MRRTPILLLTLLFFQLVSASQILRLSDGAIVEGYPSPPVRTVRQVGAYTVVTYDFHSYGIKENDLVPGTYNVTVPSFVSTAIPGEPSTLFKNDYLNVADTLSADVELVEAEYCDFHLTLAPAAPQEIMGEASATYLEPIADYEGFKPSLPIAKTGSFVHRGQGVVSMSVAPVMYSGRDTLLRLCKRIEYRVLSDSESIDTGIISMSEDEETESGPSSLEFDINHPTLFSGQPSTITNDVSRSYLIIAHSQYENALQPFIEWKRTLGMKTKAVYSSAWTVQTIKEQIRREYVRDPKLYYVLFVGNHSQVPGASVSHDPIQTPGAGNLSTVRCPSDYDYTLVTQSSVPELSRGRLSVSTPRELVTVLNKIISYEKTPVRTSAFYEKVVLMSYLDTPDFLKDNGNDKEVIANKDLVFERSCCLKCCEEVSDYLKKDDGLSVVRLYSHSPKISDLHNVRFTHYYDTVPIPDKLFVDKVWERGNSDFINAVKGGVNYGMYIGHGFPSQFVNPYYNPADSLTVAKVSKLTNGDMLPVIFSMSCLTANFNTSNIATAFLTNPSGGAVGYLGSTKDLSKDGGLRGAMICMSALLNNGTFETEILSDHRPTYLSPFTLDHFPLTMGEILNVVIMDCLSYTGSITTKQIDDKRGFHYIGDPSMFLRRTRPVDLSNVDISYTDDRIEVSTNCGKKYIAFYDMNTEESVCINDASAMYNITGGESVLALPPYVRICVYDSNSIPYIAELNGNKIVECVTVQSGMTLQCENTSPGIITVNVIGDTAKLDNPLVKLTNIIDLTETTSPLGDSTSVEIGVGIRGGYIVGLYSGSQIVSTQKINVTK